MPMWKPWRAQARDDTSSSSIGDLEKRAPERKKWSMGILNDKETDKIPGAWTSLTALNYSVASQQPGEC